MDKQSPSQTSHRWRLLLASLLTVGVTGSVWAGDGDERVRIERVINLPCAEAAGEGGTPFGMAVRNRGFLGVELTQLTPELRQHFGVPQDVGIMISKIVDDSAAFRAGLAVGDILSQVDGDEIGGPWELTSAIRGKRGGDVVDIEYWRDGRVHQVSVTLDEKEGCVFDLGSTIHHLGELGEHLPEIQMEGLRISEEAMSEAMEALRNIDWSEHLKGLEEIELDLDLDEQMEALHEQMEALEKRLSLETEHLEKEMKVGAQERGRVMKEHHKARIKAEKNARKEMIRAQKEARRAMAEAQREQAEAVREIAQELAEEQHEMAREIQEAAREAAEEAREEAEEAALDAAEEVREEAEEGGQTFWL